MTETAPIAEPHGDAIAALQRLIACYPGRTLGAITIEAPEGTKERDLIIPVRSTTAPRPRPSSAGE
jgi:hypothetical protein